MWDECEVEHKGNESKRPSETVSLIWDGDGIREAFTEESLLFACVTKISFS